MSNSGSSSSSAPPIAPTPSSSSGPPRQVPPLPSSGQKQGPPLAIQTLVPQVVSVTAPLHPILDTPEIRCFAWRTQTPRSRASNLESALSSVCWHRTKHHIPSHIQAEATAERLRPGSANPRTNAMIAAHVEKKEAARAAEAEAESKEPIPKELPFLKGKLINYNVDQGVVPAGTRRTPMELQLETYPNGHFKDMTLRGGEIKRTSLGYEYYDCELTTLDEPPYSDIPLRLPFGS
ncbi:hypothetical protein FRC02_000542 [Tulasnella sp. 418]|nr:hypothetical protein FRC02_000542 [Tulasnella sp. 418]